MNQNYNITVAIVRRKPQVSVSVPVAMIGPAVMTVDDARKLRDSLDEAIKQFEASEKADERSS